MNPFLTRRDALGHMATGLGSIALASLLGRERAGAEEGGAPHPPAKVKRVIQLFMTGGASQCDLFDYKPQLISRHGEKFDPGTGERVEASISVPGAVMKSPFSWAQHGQSGRWVSSAFPQLAKQVDDIAFLMAMQSKSNVHGPASYLQTSGFLLPGFPCLGSWLSYGLGSLSDNLPTYVVLPDQRGLPYNGRSAFTSGFLPPNHQGLEIRSAAAEPITHLRPPGQAAHVTPASRGEGLALLNELNAAHAQSHPGDNRLSARIAGYELAAQLQGAAPELLDLSKETAATKAAYGIDDAATLGFGRNCLLARRMIERGVRFVQVYSGDTNGWDAHSDVLQNHTQHCRATDKPVAGLLRDLKRRGLWNDTLVIWGGEFGRMPMSEQGKGRDHNPWGYTVWLAGGGVRGGTRYGATDAVGLRAEEKPVPIKNLHATILHLLGLRFDELTYYHNGLEERLTGPAGAEVVQEVLA